MFLIKRYKEPAILVLLWILFMFIYAYRITQFPIFEDEAELLYFADKIIENPRQNIFISMQYGPLPFLSWLISVVSLFFKDTLLGGRILNVFLASTLFFWVYSIYKLFKLSFKFFIFSSLQLLLSPILLLNSRIALWDTSVMVFSAWSIYLFLLSTKKPFFKNYVLFGFILLCSLLIKFTSFFVLAPFLIMIFKLSKGKNKKTLNKLIQIILFSVLIFLLFIVMFKEAVIGDAGVSLTVNNTLSEAVRKIYLNIWLFMNWFIVYFPIYPIYIIALIYTFLNFKKTKLPDFILILVAWLLVSTFMMVVFNRFFYPRHILIIVAPLTVIVSYFLQKIPNKISYFLVFLILSLRIFLFKDILFDYYNAEMAKEDRYAYFENYTAGVNVNEISNTLEDLSKNEKIVVWLDGTWIMEYGLRRNFKDNKNIIFKSFVKHDKWGFLPPEEVKEDKVGKNYVVVNIREPLNIESFKLIQEYSWNNHKHQYLYSYEETK